MTGYIDSDVSIVEYRDGEKEKRKKDEEKSSLVSVSLGYK
jgi:hypothetical protein